METTSASRNQLKSANPQRRRHETSGNQSITKNNNQSRQSSNFKYDDDTEVVVVNDQQHDRKRLTLRSTSTISDDSPGLFTQESDTDEVVLSSGPKIKLSSADDHEESKGYISSEDESLMSEKREPRKSVELSAKLSEEFKFGRLGVSDKEALLKKARHSFQADRSMNSGGLTSKPNGAARSLSPGNSAWASQDTRFHDDLYFTEDKTSSSWIGKSKSDDRVNRK